VLVNLFDFMDVGSRELQALAITVQIRARKEHAVFQGEDDRLAKSQRIAKFLEDPFGRRPGCRLY
jgi:hypothetical protein